MALCARRLVRKEYNLLTPKGITSMNKTAPLILLSSSIFLASCSTNSNRSFSQVATNAVLGGIVLAGLNEAKNGDKDSDGGSDGSKGLGAILIGAVVYSLYKGINKDDSNAGEEPTSKEAIAKIENELSWRVKTENGKTTYNFKDYGYVGYPYPMGESDKLIKFKIVYLASRIQGVENGDIKMGGVTKEWGLVGLRNQLSQTKKLLNKERGNSLPWLSGLVAIVVAGVVIKSTIDASDSGNSSSNTTKKTLAPAKKQKGILLPTLYGKDARGAMAIVQCKTSSGKVKKIRVGYHNKNNNTCVHPDSIALSNQYPCAFIVKKVEKRCGNM